LTTPSVNSAIAVETRETTSAAPTPQTKKELGLAYGDTETAFGDALHECARRARDPIALAEDACTQRRSAGRVFHAAHTRIA
jgi:hypothetical protein